MARVPDFELSGPGYVYSQVAAHIERRIRAGELAPGARLANERDLAEEYQVALGTIRRAMEVLREKGLVITMPSTGTYVKELDA
jgi:DNA-binding GntR family transcriptional regulator